MEKNNSEETEKQAGMKQHPPGGYPDEEVADVIRKAIELKHSGVKVLYIALIGSRAKGLHSEESDYDSKVIVLESKRTYLLEKVHENINIATEINRITVEGTCIDLLHFYDYVRTQNQWAGECIRGKCIYSISKEFERSLFEIFKSNFDSLALAKQYMGWLKSERKIHTKKGKVNEIPVKYAVEALHLANVIAFIRKFPGVVPPREFQEVLGAIEMEEELRKDINRLYELRRKAKNQIVSLEGPSNSYVRRTMEANFKEELEGKRNGSTSQEEFERMFLMNLLKYAKEK